MKDRVLRNPIVSSYLALYEAGEWDGSKLDCLQSIITELVEELSKYQEHEAIEFSKIKVK